MNLESLNWTGGIPLESETFEDEEFKDIQPSLVPRQKECTHMYERNEWVTEMLPKRFSNVSASNARLGRLMPEHLVAARDLLPVPTYDMDALAESALAFMLPELNQGSSILNFAYELRELKEFDPRDSFKRVTKGKTTLRSLASKTERGGFLKDLIRRLAGAHLGAEFGLIPFVKDIADAYDALAGLENRLKRLKARSAAWNTRHYKRVLPYEPGKFHPKFYTESNVEDYSASLSSTWFNSTWGYPSRDLSPTPTVKVDSRWIQRPTYYATAAIRYEMPQFDTPLEEEIAAKAEALGVRLDPTILWNATRFTFLVDWVVDVSGFLSQFARETYRIEYAVKDFCHSLRWHKESTASVFERWDSPGWEASMPPLPSGYDPSLPGLAWKGTDSYYIRRRASPSPSSVVSKRASLRKAALAGSLLIANSPFLKNGRDKYLRRAALK